MTYLSENARMSQTSGMTRREAILYAIDVEGFADETIGNSDWGDGMSRIGRHILGWNGHGIFTMISYATEAVAERAFADMATAFYSDDDDDAS